MLTIIIPNQEFYNEETEEFINLDEVVLKFEHSLVSLSKWESKFEKPFLSTPEKSDEEIIAYIQAMELTGTLSFDVYNRLTQEHLNEINTYIASSQSATTFSDVGERRGVRSEVITSELIYYWMTIYNIPFECEEWHLNRLFALLRICNIKNSKEKKMSRSEAAAQQRSLNAQRRAQMGTRG